MRMASRMRRRRVSSFFASEIQPMYALLCEAGIWLKFSQALGLVVNPALSHSGMVIWGALRTQRIRFGQDEIHPGETGLRHAAFLDQFRHQVLV